MMVEVDVMNVECTSLYVRFYVLILVIFCFVYQNSYS